MIIMITGGQGAGKTTYALELSKNYRNKMYLATAEVTDPEMELKINAHKMKRSSEYVTVEEPLELAATIKKFQTHYDIILIDCLTTWTGNILYHKINHNKYLSELTELLQNIKTNIIFVTNEVGLGIIPADSESRKYSAMLAKTNAAVSQLSDKVCFMVSTVPMWIKQ